jgi:muramoyltetrapeptide carboxypeptidase
MTMPQSLKPGDTIGVMAPSSYVERDDIERSTAVLEQRGYKVFVHPQTFEREHQSAGNHLQKSLAFQGLWQREDIKVIWAAGGGNRSLRLLKTINFEKLKSKPKLLVGFSDVTTLLNGVYAHTGIPTIHGPVFKNLHKHEQMDQLFDLLSGKSFDLSFDQTQALHEGEAQGPLIGGNLSLFQYLPGVLPERFWTGGILFLEDWNEELSKIDRMLAHLKNVGIFDEVRGVIFGQFGVAPDTGRPYGYTLEDILREHVAGIDIPVVMNAPFGHSGTLLSWPVGGLANLQVSAKKSSLSLIDPIAV